MANYYDEINILMKTVVHKLEIMNKKGISYGKGFEKITILETVIVAKVANEGKLSTTELIDAVDVDRGVTTTSINRLIKGRILEKNQDEVDRRKFYLTMAKKGEELVKAMRVKEDDFLKFVLDEITINEAKAILKFLSKINQTTVDKFEIQED